MRDVVQFILAICFFLAGTAAACAGAWLSVVALERPDQPAAELLECENQLFMFAWLCAGGALVVGFASKFGQALLGLPLCQRPSWVAQIAALLFVVLFVCTLFTGAPRVRQTPGGWERYERAGRRPIHEAAAVDYLWKNVFRNGLQVTWAGYLSALLVVRTTSLTSRRLWDPEDQPRLMGTSPTEEPGILSHDACQ
jgi:uncharacterized membrane protein YtjA (UPF0391 family)